MRVKTSKIDTRDVLRYLEKDKGAYLRVWESDTIVRDEVSAEVIYRGQAHPVSLRISRSVRESKSVYWCGGTIGAQDYRWKRKKKLPPISSAAKEQRKNARRKR